MVKQKWSYWISALMMIFLGLIFVVAGFGKLMANSASLNTFLLSPYPSINIAYVLLPYVEIIIGSFLVLGILVKPVAGVALGLSVIFAAVNISMISQGIGTCGECFGVIGELSSYAALTMDILMIALAIGILVLYHGKYLSFTPWYLESGHNADGAPSLGAPEA